jgi:hypothetical protein
MWGDDLPHQSHPLEKDIWDVEECEEPLVLGVRLVDRARTFTQSSGLSISDVGTVEEGDEVYIY